jgi:hypothetical protein
MSTIKVNNIVPPNVGEGVTIDGLQMPTAGPLSNRNLIINGAMQVAQRGTTATVSNGSNEGYSTVDRWFLNFNDSISGATTFSQSTDAPSGFSNSAKIQCFTTASSFSSNQYLALQHKFEAQNLQSLAYGTADAKSITVSWYMKTDTYTDPISFSLFTDDGTAEYYTVSVTPTTSWARYSVTVPGSATATINNDNGAGLFLQFVLAGNTSSAIAAGSDSAAYSTTRADFRTDVGNLLSSTSNAIYITGVQLEVGSKATPFEHRSYGQELALCQRYYQLLRNAALFAGTANGTTQVGSIGIPLAVAMRAAPTVANAQTFIVWHGTAGGVTSSSTTMIILGNPGLANLRGTVNDFTGLTDNRAAVIGAQASPIQLNAEL